MALDSVSVGNFKGLYAPQNIALRPITLFIGANSSGKSSVIHALAALAQTVTLPNNTRPLVLDDEFAYVHLGRFIEIIHSKNYSDTIVLGVQGGDVRIRTRSGQGDISGSPSVVYTFKSTRKTQDVFLESAEVNVGGKSFAATRSKRGVYTLTYGEGASTRIDISSGFSFDISSLGFEADLYTKLRPLFAAQRAIEQELRKTLYLGPFREPPRRRYPTRGSAPREVGPQGEATVTLLANEMVRSASRPHAKQVSAWFQMLGLANSLGVSRIGSSDLFDVNITLKDGKRFPLADLGYGLSQVLPVLTQLSFCPDSSTLLFEQPELHLHPLAARALAPVFIDAVTKKHVHILAETHAPEFFGQFIREMRAGNFRREDFIAYQVTRQGGCSHIAEIEVDENFDIYSPWRTGLSE
jgi:predicted ATPase